MFSVKGNIITFINTYVNVMSYREKWEIISVKINGNMTIWIQKWMIGEIYSCMKILIMVIIMEYKQRSHNTKIEKKERQKGDEREERGQQIIKLEKQ